MSGGTSGDEVREIGGHRVKLTHLDKVLYPETGWTKRDVLDYYAKVADVLIPLAADRPATRKRWVDGVGTAEHPGAMFFAKNLERGAPGWLKTGRIEHSTHANTYPLVNDTATLLWLGQMATLEVHAPQWRFGGNGRPRHPDRLVLDLDPGEGAGLAECAAVARLAKAIVDGIGLELHPVTSGSKGIHLYARLDGTRSSDDIAKVAHELARALEADHPDLVVSDMKKARRAGKVLVDWSQNNAAKTTIVPYSLRGTWRPMAAAPRTWAELARKDLRQLEPHEVLDRLRRRGDPLTALHADQDAPGLTDALTRYRGMRDPGKTPEPGVLAAGSDATRSGAAAERAGVPADRPKPGDGDTFVIQEHHARRLHWDFRLERDGVLVSWALPKGVPGLGEKNHLAVHTEDHPLDYGSFEGDIPKGEYGGGHVSIWDAGTYTAEKWRESEVIATLIGGADGGLGGEAVKVALIRTGQGRRKDGQDPNDHSGEQWLIHRMALEPSGSNAGASEHATRRSSRSGASKRTSAPEDAPTHPASRPAAPKPMLATPVGPFGLDPDVHWSMEMKWDGIRAIGTIEGGAVRLVSRNGLDLTATFPELAALADAVDGDALVDGEIVALDERGRPNFSLLQQRNGLTKQADVERARRAVAVRYFVFDLLQEAGHSLVHDPYSTRRDRLDAVVHPLGPIDVPPVVAAATGDELEHAVADAMATSSWLGLEGVVAKRTDGPYAAGRRSGDWLKIKHEQAQEVVVGGWRPGSGRREGGIGSLLLGIPTEQGLAYVGRVGTGFTDRDLDEIGARLRPLARTTTPFVDVPNADARDAHWVTPRFVGEVKFAEWTPDGRLRQPSWRGWRADKTPGDVRRES